MDLVHGLLFRIDQNVSESGYVSVFGCLGGDAAATAVSSGDRTLLVDQLVYCGKGKMLCFSDVQFCVEHQKPFDRMCHVPLLEPFIMARI